MSRCEQLLEEGLKNHIYSGAALAVGKGDQIFVKKTIGTVSYDEGAAPVTASTLFDMASLSKILGTTFCAFHMIQDGTLCLADTLDELLPDVPEDKKNITVFNLMTHTSGIPSEIFLYRVCTSPDQAVETILNTPLAYPTGKGCVRSRQSQGWQWQDSRS